MTGEIRVYEGFLGYVEDILCASGETHVKILATIPGQEEEVIFACRHDFFQPPPSFSLAEHRSFGFALPPDVFHFFQKFPRVIFWGHGAYDLGIPGLLRSYAMDEELPRPYGLFRFCRVEWAGSLYFALRTKDGGETWDVVLLGTVCSDLEEVLERPSLYPSFTAWLSDMLEYDGWMPWIRDYFIADGLTVIDRVLPAGEIAAKFGDIHTLLPPAVPSKWEIPTGDD